MADQCIVCLEDLDVVPEPIHEEVVAGPSAAASITQPGKVDNQQQIALIKPCNHVLHDQCLREWSQKANSCPICRQAFNLVEVLDKVGGTVLSEYAVEGKKQVAEFDPSAWIEDEYEEEEEERPCPICGYADQEDVLLLCDQCDAPYHTFCVGLDRVPTGSWFCMECASTGAYADAAAVQQESGSRPARRLFPRTQADMRRSRRRTRPDQWLGAWSRFSRTIHHVAGLDLDFSEDDQSMASYRQHQLRITDEIRGRDAWRQRYHIAERQGAREAFQRVAPLAQRVRDPVPEPPVETIEEKRAWSAFDRARQAEDSPRSRKRKSRSTTASPAEPPQEPKEPERKLKRPRTRRVLDTAGPSSAASQILQTRRQSSSRPRPDRPQVPNASDNEPSFLSSLLQEVEMAKSSDDDTMTPGTAMMPDLGRVTSPALDYLSPASSPSPTSSTHTPRAMSMTPPNNNRRPGSPIPLTSRVEPIFPPADYLSNRSPGESAQKSNSVEQSNSPTTEIRHPRPRRQTSIKLARSKDTSPTKANMSMEAKEGINKIVKTALSPHWKSAEITKEHYANINRDVSRMMYEMIPDRNLDEAERNDWEKIAAAKVATAVRSLTT